MIKTITRVGIIVVLHISNQVVNVDMDHRVQLGQKVGMGKMVRMDYQEMMEYQQLMVI